MNNIQQKLEKNLDGLLEIALGAGDIILNYLKSGFKVFEKSDGSPVTEADIASDKFISHHLQKIMPGIFVVSEEGYESDPKRYLDVPDVFWCVDPLDGTKNFINREDEFTVNIGLVVDKKPVFGILYVPSGDRLYFSTPQGGFKIHAGKKTKLKQSTVTDKMSIIASKRSDSHIKDLLKDHAFANLNYEYRKMASSEKICYLADSEFNVFPHFADSKEWDTVAVHAILNAAGGKIFAPGGCELEYGKSQFQNPYFIAVSSPQMFDKPQLLSLIKTLD